MGNPAAWRNNYMTINTHWFPSGTQEDLHNGNDWPLPAGATAGGEFHTYGVWWKDNATAWFYFDGQKVASLTLPTKFNSPLWLFFDTEVFTWDGLPALADLHDPNKNVMQIDFVHAYTLVPKI